MNFNFRKIGSVIASAVMLGSTLGFAAANYPAPFVKNGAADVAVVWGTTAANTDLAAVVDITTSLQTELAKQTATTSGATDSMASGGDSYKIERASTKFQLGNGMLDVVSGTITDSELPVLLADGTYTDDDNDDFDYTQKLVVPNSTLQMFEDSDYKADAPTVGIRYASGANVLNYTLDFSEDPLWGDLPTTDMTFLGKTYYVLSRTTNTSLTLLDSGETSTINEGEEKTLTVGDKSYTVKINFVGSNSTKLEVNGEVTKSLNPTDTYKLSDGSYVGIKEVNYNSKDTGISNVEFSLGKGKLKLQNATDVQMNDNSISNLQTIFTSSSSSDEASGKLNTLTLVWKADDDLFATEDSSALMPGFEAVKVSFGGMSYPKTETLTADQGSDDYVVLKDFPMKTSTETIDLLYNNGTNYTVIGKDTTHRLVTSGNTSLLFDGDTDQYFVATYNDGTNAESYLVRAASFSQDSTGTINRTTISYRKDGSWVNIEENAEPAKAVTIGSTTFTLGAIDKNAKTVYITATGSTNFNTLYSKEGMKVNLPWYNASQVGPSANGINGITINLTTTDITATVAGTCGNVTNQAGAAGYNITYVNQTGGAAGTVNCLYFPATYSLVFTEEDKNENKAGGKTVTVGLGYSTTNTEVIVSSATPSVGGSSTEVGDSDVFRNFVYSALATEIMWDKSGSADFPVTLTYHGAESYGNVFVLSPSASVSEAESGSSGGSVKELGSVSITDAQVGSVSKNLIVVGGSCVNTVASQLLDGAACGDSFTAKTGVGNGQFLIQTFSRTDGKVATLVAGYNAVDTTNAAKYLTTQQVDTTVGKKYTGTSATSATLQVA